MKKNFVIQQGTDWESSFMVRDRDGDLLNFSQYEFIRSKMRKEYGYGIGITLGATFSDALGATSGYMQMSLGATESSAIGYGTYVYDVEAVSGDGKVSRIVEGRIDLTPEATD